MTVMDHDPAEVLSDLTEKQIEVLDLLLQHKTTKQIARELAIAPNTVDARIATVRDKWGTVDRKATARVYAHLLETCEKPTCGFSPLETTSFTIMASSGNCPGRLCSLSPMPNPGIVRQGQAARGSWEVSIPVSVSLDGWPPRWRRLSCLWRRSSRSPWPRASKSSFELESLHFNIEGASRAGRPIMDRKLAGIRISRELKDLEDQLDTILTAAAELSADVTEARVFYRFSGFDATGDYAPRKHELSSTTASAQGLPAHGDLGKAAAGTTDFPTDCPPNCWALELLDDAA